MMTTTHASLDLHSALTQLGVDVRRSNEKEITAICPVHERVTGRPDHSPSWSMNATTGLWLCFSCGARGTLGMLIEELTGSSESTVSIHNFLISNALVRHQQGSNTFAKPEPDIDWLSFNKFGSPPASLLNNKKLYSDIARKYGIKWDIATDSWIIPIVSPFGELKGWQRKNAYTRSFKNFPTGVQKSETLFGIERFCAQTAVLLESPLDVVRLAGVYEAPQGVASFGAGVSREQINILAERADRLVLALDNDAAGMASMKKWFSALPYFRKGVYFLNYGKSKAKDIGDMSDDEIKWSIRNITLLPPWSS